MLPTDCGGVEADRCHHGVVHSPCMGLLGHWLIYVLLLIIIVTAIWSANYLQKALMVSSRGTFMIVSSNSFMF